MSSLIYTRSGDTGQTSLVGGARVGKDNPRVEAYGAVDETNSWVGLARADASDPVLARVLEFVQHRLYNCSSNVATPPGSTYAPPVVDEADVAFLERAIDEFEARTGPITAFVLPGGSRLSGVLHVARTVARRAERRLIALAGVEPVDARVVKFLNRASDLLFAAARYANRLEGSDDVFWDKQLPIPPI